MCEIVIARKIPATLSAIGLLIDLPHSVKASPTGSEGLRERKTHERFTPKLLPPRKITAGESRLKTRNCDVSTFVSFSLPCVSIEARYHEM